MPSFWPYTTEKFIYENTMFPFYAPFLKPNTTEQLFQLMKGKNGGGIYNITGIMPSSIKSNSFLKFCPLCFQDDIKLRGESYWRRSHQVPNISVCHQHNSFLLDSSVRIPPLNKHEYYHACLNVCPSSLKAIQVTQHTMTHLINLATDVYWLINQRVPSYGFEWLRKRYLNELIIKGVATPTGRVDQSSFKFDFTAYYGNEFLAIVQSEVSKTDGWLEASVRKQRCAIHPIRHLLLMRYLKGSPEHFFQDCLEYKPFGNAPWPCLNAAVSHYHQDLISDLSITYCRDTKRPVGTFTCDCGFQYSRRGPDSCLRDRYKIGRIKRFGELWEKELLILNAQGLSYRAIARKLNVDTNTVINKLGNLLVEPKSNIQECADKLQIDELEQKRQQWLKAQDEHPGISKKQLRNLQPKLYSWLYRHDKEWLLVNPAKTKVSHVKSRVNWSERDCKILTKVKEAVKQLLDEEDHLQRITISKIGKRAGVLGLLQKHRDKMPETDCYLKMVVETVEEFQLRRVKNTISEFIKQGSVPERWMVESRAGLRKGYSERIKKTIEDGITMGWRILQNG